MNPVITEIRARAVAAPIRRPPMSASGAIDKAALVLIDLDTDAGVTGHAYLFAFGSAMLRPLCGCVEAAAAEARGQALAPLALDARLRRRFTLIDPKGLLGLALAGIDMAAWDALARWRELPLVRLLGAEPRPLPAYNSCGLWIGPVEALADEADALCDEGGFDAIKVRLGRPDGNADVDAVRRLRRHLPESVSLMSDFNQSLSRNEATLRCQRLDDEGLYWFEEPLRHDDYEGCAELAGRLLTPLQIGENLAGPNDLQRAIDAGAARYCMPDVQRIGGVTGWLRAAAIAHAHDIDLSSHLFPEISVHLLAASPTAHWLEYMDWANPVLAEPLAVVNGQVVAPERPGTGIAWDEDAVARYAV